MNKEKSLLKFAIIGNIDDGKSSLIGKLLLDSKAIYDDQLEVLEKISTEQGYKNLNYALLTDGLKSEREQGITIDIAYRYFSTQKRKFIIIDCPGHFQYTHNTFTGLSGVNTAILLIDASKGIKEQTRRHTFLCSLLEIKHLIVCINKMDLVNYSQEIYEKIKSEFIIYTKTLNIKQIDFIPTSNLNGDNLINHSDKTPWYQGKDLMYLLENININNSHLNLANLRFPIQNILHINTSGANNYRAYTGKIESGTLKIGDSVTLLPSGFNTQIKSINFAEKSLEQACAGMSISIQLNDELDVSVGNMIIKTNTSINISQNIELLLYSVSSMPIKKHNKYILKHITQNTKCIIQQIDYKININSLQNDYQENTLNNNDIGKITLHTSEPLLFDSYKQNKNTGSLILIDEITNNTIAAGIIL
jgi:sulfate adenylyltransferase subunit 1